MPVLPLTRWTDSGVMPSELRISSMTSSGRAADMSSLLRIGMTFQIAVDREVGIGNRLGFDALRRVDEEEGSLAAARLRDTS
jgi:hypothetical protein